MRATPVGHRDANEKPIVSVMRQMGATVSLVRGVRGIPDLVVGVGGRNVWVEVKTEDGKLGQDQARFATENRGGLVFIVRTPAQAIDLVTFLRSLPPDPLWRCLDADDTKASLRLVPDPPSPTDAA